MAQNRLKVLLGFDDEMITEKYKNQINFTTNKIGGKPDLPSNIKLELPICPLCQLPRPLVVQIYAPLENSNYHRTLYVFACINPNCWNHSESWICLRIQTQEKITEIDDYDDKTTTSRTNTNLTDWCTDADDWGGGNNDDDDNNCNMNEENGNLINNFDKISDEDDESCSFDESVRLFGNLTVDERNANSGALGGAVGRQHSPPASAEIEGDEGEVVIVDTPTYPQRDIVALLQEVTPLPQDLCSSNTTAVRNRSNYFQFVPYFLSVWEENDNHAIPIISDRHVKELLQEYQQNNIDDINAISPADKNLGGGATGGGRIDMRDNENYEKTNPAHGDKMFHYFLTRIQMNPGQILRYHCRDSNVEPLLLYPIQNLTKYCSYCRCELQFELQILPTIITKLKLITSKDQKTESRLEFGNVLIFTCRNSCWSNDTNWRYETVVLQSETY